MAAVATPRPSAQPISVPGWVWVLLIFAMLTAYVVLQENGAVISQSERIHEFFHDGRHALGFPCH